MEADLAGQDLARGQLTRPVAPLYFCRAWVRPGWRNQMSAAGDEGRGHRRGEQGGQVGAESLPPRRSKPGRNAMTSNAANRTQMPAVMGAGAVGGRCGPGCAAARIFTPDTYLPSAWPRLTRCCYADNSLHGRGMSMKSRWVQNTVRYAQSPQGRRTIEQVINRVRAFTRRSGRGGQLLGKLDTPATRQRLEQLLRGRSRRW